MVFRKNKAIFSHFATVILSIGIVFPFVWIFINSIKRQVDIYTGTLRFSPTWINYNRLLFSKQAHFIMNITNSIIVAAGSTLLVMLCATFMAYALDRFRWPKWVPNVFLGWTIVFRMIPPITFVGSWYVLFRRIGLYNSLTGLMLTHVALNLPVATWLMMSFVQDAPRELEYAALIDGCGYAGAFFRIVLPLIAPGLVASSIISFVYSWNEFVVAVSLTTSDTETITVGISKFAQLDVIQHGHMAAAAIIATVPGLLVVYFGQKYIVKGLTLGALKS